MPSLQIRDMPNDLYQALSARATLEHRSLTQQALVELVQALRAKPNNRRQQVLARIRADILLSALPPEFSPEQLIRDDRSR